MYKAFFGLLFSFIGLGLSGFFSLISRTASQVGISAWRAVLGIRLEFLVILSIALSFGPFWSGFPFIVSLEFYVLSKIMEKRLDRTLCQEQ